MSTQRKPDWLMSVAQHASYFRLFNDVYARLKIPYSEREAFRKETHRKVFGSPISAKQINPTDMFGKIKNHLLMLLDNVQGTVETDHPEHDEKRRKLTFIRSYQFPLLNVFLHPSDSSDTSQAEHYARAIAKARWKKDHLEFLTVQQLGYLRMDLARAIQSKRKAADMTVHQLHQAAKLPCPFNCQECAHQRASVMECAAAAALSTDDNLPF